MTHSQLIARLEQLAGPDREVDAEIWCLFRGVRYVKHFSAYGQPGLTQVAFKEKGKRLERISDGSTIPHALAYTASVDAALALAEKALPWMRIISTCDDTLACSAKIWVYPNGLSNGGEFMVEGMHEDMPVALCIAILKAHGASK